MSQDNDHWGTLPELIPTEFRPGSRPSWWNRIKRILGVPHKAGELPSIAVVEPTRPAPSKDEGDILLARLRSIEAQLKILQAKIKQREQQP